jgi:hypothetical protein
MAERIDALQCPARWHPKPAQLELALTDIDTELIPLPPHPDSSSTSSTTAQAPRENKPGALISRAITPIASVKDR